MKSFEEEVVERVRLNGQDEALCNSAKEFSVQSVRARYSYNFSWLGRPIIQYPQDIVAMQEIIWRVKPELIIETGIAHGGSLLLWASLLELNKVCGGPSSYDVLGIDIDIRPHNRRAVEEHPMSDRIHLIQGSSVDPEIVAHVQDFSEGAMTLVCLDSNHTHDHVLAELEAYSPLVSVGSYCVVFDTIIEDLPEDSFSDRSWGRGNNPKTAVNAFLESHYDFEIDYSIQNKLQITVAPDGYLKRVK